MSKLQQTFDEYQQARTWLLIKYGTMENVSDAVRRDRSITDDWPEKAKEVAAFMMCNLEDKFHGNPDLVLASIKERKARKYLSRKLNDNVF